VAKARSWTFSDAETRKLGERTGLDTPVVLAVNDGHWVGGSPMGSLPQGNREVPRLGSMVARLKLKGIDGGSHKRWSMWLNSRLREEPYPGLDMHGLVRRKADDTARWNVHRCCMAVVSSCREVLG
jgi:hypothetical protein